ncbi:related to APN2 - AP endonuclease, exonuclease III homolog [Moesziomyces antarcticus]|uniref:DNA-(apurinic or apyrimidinic site) endonuclease n=1 Tax=Pseudozyma antarctica TaxID=84753 RepID=A0A5C3FFU8_PSEA2|nr:related to APN2 - AP endonuclease, exonuclease III homolog [Moesziomyces antarcticus]
MRITVWNINGLRTLKGYQPWYKLPDWEACLEHLGADIACFQETKMTRKQLTEAMCILPSYNAFFNFHPTKGYSGTVTYVRKSASIPLKAEQGITGRLCDTPAPSNPTIPNEPIGHVPADTRDDVEPQLWQALDDEGRAVVVDLGLFVLFNVYCPNETGPERLEYKMTYYQCLAERAHRLIAAGRNVMIVGDMNIIRDPIDHCDPEQSMRENGWDHFHQHPARAWFASFLAPQGKFHDVGRMFHPERRKMFTCWNTLIDARPANYGVRLDYTLVSEGLLPWVKGADIQPDIYGSDHCPIYIDLHDEREVDGKTVRLAELMHGGATRLPPALAACHYDEFSGKQRKLASFFSAARTPAIKRTDIPSASDTPKGASSQQTESASVGATAAGLAPPQAQDSQHAITSGESDAESSSLVDSLFSLHSQQEGLHVEYASQAPRSEQAAALPSTPSPTKPNPAQTASPVASAPARASMVPRKDSSAEASPMKRNGGSPKRTVASKGKDAAKGKSAAGLKGQTSLQAFFARPASSFSDAADTDTDSAEQAPPSQPSSQVDHVGASADASDAGCDMPDDDAIQEFQNQASASPPRAAGSEQSATDRIGASLAWGAIFSPLPPPLCRHSEACRAWTVNKPGPNHGRKFWLCSRPVGPGYEKTGRAKGDVNPEYRCNFFLWDSERRAEASRARKQAPASGPKFFAEVGRDRQSQKRDQDDGREIGTPWGPHKRVRSDSTK